MFFLSCQSVMIALFWDDTFCSRLWSIHSVNLFPIQPLIQLRLDFHMGTYPKLLLPASILLIPPQSTVILYPFLILQHGPALNLYLLFQTLTKLIIYFSPVYLFIRYIVHLTPSQHQTKLTTSSLVHYFLL